MSEGSSLSARESLTALGRAGFHIEIVDPSHLCLARFSKWCSRLHRPPKFGVDPEGYLHFVADLLATSHFDVLYPAHEQAYLFARYGRELGRLTHLALPPFAVFERMQSKVGFARVLEELGLPGAATTIVYDERGLVERAARFPLYVKTAFGTATQGTFRLESREELPRVIEAAREVLAEGVLLQEPLEGPLGRTQAVFAAGRLVGFHACVQVEEGVGGGDLIKESIDVPLVREHVERLGKHLGWHGGLSLDFITDANGGPRYIDSNPRLAETGNALAAGLNLPELLVQVSLGREPIRCLTGKPGVRSFMGIQALLKTAETSASRCAVTRTLAELVAQRHRFTIGTEELTPANGDRRALLPLAAVAGALLANPRSWKRFSSTTVKAYAATPGVVQFVRRGQSSFHSPSSLRDG